MSSPRGVKTKIGGYLGSLSSQRQALQDAIATQPEAPFAAEVLALLEKIGDEYREVAASATTQEVLVGQGTVSMWPQQDLVLDHARGLHSLSNQITDEFVALYLAPRPDRTEWRKRLRSKLNTFQQRFADLTQTYLNRQVGIGINEGLRGTEERWGVLEQRVETRIARLDQALADSDTLKAWMDSNAKVLQDAIEGKHVSDTIEAFADRALEHRAVESEYREYFLLSLLGGVVAVAILWHSNLSEAATTAMIVSFVLKRGVLLAGASALMRVTLRRWNLERNLRLLYEHRVAALKQYVLFDGTILPEDREAKDRFRLALAGMLFSDPRTGYIEENGSELSINPTFNMDSAVGRLSPK